MRDNTIFLYKGFGMNVNTHKKMLVASVFALSLLPGCAWFGSSEKASQDMIDKEKNTSTLSDEMLMGEVIATMNGKPIVTSSVLEMEKENIFKSNPQIRAAIAFMDPKVLDRNLTDGLVGQAAVDQYVKEEGLNQSAEYKAELKDAQKAIERMLNAKYFSQKFNVTVSDAEAQKFYDANKDSIPGLLVSQGGVMASGIEFDNQNSAREFLAKAKTMKNDLKKAADEAGLSSKIKDFKMINAQSVGIDPALRDKIVAMKVVPGSELVSVGNKFWVVSATSKEEPKYRPFDQIKEGIKQEVEKNKRGEMFEKEVSALKKKYNIVINEDYFKGSEGAEQNMMNEEDMSSLATGGLAQKDQTKNSSNNRA